MPGNTDDIYTTRFGFNPAEAETDLRRLEERRSGLRNPPEDAPPASAAVRRWLTTITPESGNTVNSGLVETRALEQPDLARPPRTESGETVAVPRPAVFETVTIGRPDNLAGPSTQQFHTVTIERPAGLTEAPSDDPAFEDLTTADVDTYAAIAAADASEKQPPVQPPSAVEATEITRISSEEKLTRILPFIRETRTAAETRHTRLRERLKNPAPLNSSTVVTELEALRSRSLAENAAEFEEQANAVLRKLNEHVGIYNEALDAELSLQKQLATERGLLKQLEMNTGSPETLKAKLALRKQIDTTRRQLGLVSAMRSRAELLAQEDYATIDALLRDKRLIQLLSTEQRQELSA